MSQLSHKFVTFLTVPIPTEIHIIFTGNPHGHHRNVNVVFPHGGHQLDSE